MRVAGRAPARHHSLLSQPLDSLKVGRHAALIVHVCRMADAIVINKANTAPVGSIDKLREAAKRINPRATVSERASERVRGARCVLVTLWAVR